MKRVKQILAMLLSVAMLLCAVPILVQAGTNGHSQSDAVNWANSKNGQSLDYDGVYGAQCVDFTAYYYQYLGAAAYVGGNANAYQTRSIPNGWSRVYYSSGITFQPGDIAVWKTNLSWQNGYSTTSTGDLGHVGVILSADNVGFNAAEQNANNKQYVTINWHYNSELFCVIRPDFTNYFSLDLNGYLDGQNNGGIFPYGTVDIYINGTRVADDCNDFYGANGSFLQGSTYEIKDIKAANGYIYNGVKEGSLKGTLNSDTNVRLSFTTDLGSAFYANLAKKNVSKNLEASSEVTQEQQNSSLNNLQIAKNGNDLKNPRQIWYFTRQSDGTYKIQNMYDNSVVDVYGAYTDVCTNVITTRDDHGGSNQRWFISSVSGGYRLIPAHATAMSLDVYGDSDNNGANVCIHSQNTTNAQIFSISKISYSKPAKPAASTVSVASLGVPNATTTLSWTASALKDSSFDSRSYTLILTKDGAAYQTKTGLTATSINLTLPKGTYTAKIRAINTKYYEYYTDGNALTFSVKECTTHTWNSGTITKKATCTEEGIRTYTCTVNGCGATRTEPISKIDHAITVINKKDATYDAEGYTGDTYCTVCRQTLSYGTSIPKLTKPEEPTNPNQPATQPTTQQQQQTGGCKWCGQTHGGILGALVGFFHSILALLFGAKY